MPLPVWALVKMHVGLADAILEFELNKMHKKERKRLAVTQRLKSKKRVKNNGGTAPVSSNPNPDPNPSRSNHHHQHHHHHHHPSNNNNDNSSVMNAQIEKAKRHYRITLKYSGMDCRAHLGLARIFAFFGMNPRRAEYHYSKTIEACDQLIAMFKHAKNVANSNDTKNNHENDGDGDGDGSGDDKGKNAHVDWENLDLTLDNLTIFVTDPSDQKKVKEYFEKKCNAHLEYTKLLLSHFTEKRWKEALQHCKEVRRCHSKHINAFVQTAIVHSKLAHFYKALQFANCALGLAKEFDQISNTAKSSSSSSSSSALSSAPSDSNSNPSSSPKVTCEMEVRNALRNVFRVCNAHSESQSQTSQSQAKQ